MTRNEIKTTQGGKFKDIFKRDRFSIGKKRQAKARKIIFDKLQESNIVENKQFFNVTVEFYNNKSSNPSNFTRKKRSTDAVNKSDISLKKKRLRSHSKRIIYCDELSCVTVEKDWDDRQVLFQQKDDTQLLQNTSEFFFNDLTWRNSILTQILDHSENCQTNTFMESEQSQSMQLNMERNNESMDNGLYVPLDSWKKKDVRSNSLGSVEKHLLSLYYLCNKYQVPGDMFDSIISIFHNAYIENKNDFQMMFQFSKDTFWKKVEKTFPIPRAVSQITRIEIENDWNGITMPRIYKEVKIPIFNAKDQILDLLGDDELFTNIDNLVVNKTNPYAPYKPPNGKNEELMDADFVQGIYKSGLLKGNTILIPLICYTDKACVTKNQRIGVEPIIMALGNLSKKARYLGENVRPLGYIPNFDQRSTAEKASENQKNAGKGRNCRNYHSCLNLIMNSIRDAQEYFLQNETWVRFGDFIKKVKIYMPLAYFVGDGKSQDMLACRYSSYSDSLRLCRACSVSYEFSDMAGRSHCLYLKNQYIKDLVCNSDQIDEKERRERLKNKCVHNCYNALWNVDIGGQEYLPLPHDLMHILSGITKTLLELTYSPLSNNEKSGIDKLAAKLFAEPRSSEKSNFPRVDFTRGFTSLTHLTATEWMGTLLVTVILAQTKNGYELMKECFTRCRVRNNDHSADNSKCKISNEKELPPLKSITVENLLETYEEILIFYAWYKRGYGSDWEKYPPKESSHFYWNPQSNSNLTNKLTKIQKLILNNFERRKGDGWKRQKFHELIHIPRDIDMYGLPWNYDAGWGEKNLKPYGIRPSKNASKIYGDTFITGVANRVSESLTLKKAIRICPTKILDTSKTQQINWLERSNNNHNINCVIRVYSQKHTQWEILMEHGIAKECNWSDKKSGVTTICVHELIVDFLANRYKASTQLYGYTEFQIIKETTEVREPQKFIFRSHPAFRGGQPWYDWCMLKYEDTVRKNMPENQPEGITPSNEYPAKIISIFNLPEDDPGTGGKKGDLMLLVHVCESVNHNLDTLLTEKWKLEYKDQIIFKPRLDDTTRNVEDDMVRIKGKVPVLRVVSVESVVDRIFVVEEMPKLKKYITLDNKSESDTVIYVRDMDYWPFYFQF